MTPQLTDIHLSQGNHPSREDGMCLLEAVAFFSGEEHSDHPACVHPVLASFGRSLNDVLLPGREDLHDRLRSLVPRLAGTSDGDGQRWGLMAVDWLIRVYTPTWLRLVPEFIEHAEGLERLDEITSWEDLPVQRLLAACNATGNACDAAGPDAWSTTWDATGAAAVAATVAAAVAAAMTAAAMAAAAGAATMAAGAAARAAAVATALNAAEDALRPTVRHLQESALELLERMVGVPHE